MKPADGYNPMRWDCDKSGCYNKVHRPKIEEFASALPGKIAMTDIDATVEVNGHFLHLEWKFGGPRPLPTGQRLYAERLTKLSNKIIYLVICGNAETMVVSHVGIIRNGDDCKWEQCDFQGLYDRINRWATHVKGVSA